MVRIVEAVASDELLKASALLRDFPEHQREHYAAHARTVERYFDPIAYEVEVQHLTMKYGAPDGCVLLALDHDVAAGVVCLRRFDAEACEMKRLYVPVAQRRKGIAQALTLALLDIARHKGYARMLLDTGAFMPEPQAFYRKMGFTYTEPYYDVPEGLRGGLVFMRIHL